MSKRLEECRARGYLWCRFFEHKKAIFLPQSTQRKF
ncbi:hypothetical protein SCG7109_AG_00060 [Chlamydiales bacterium SCGC AG-110-M15]|nr:hypothetical protein SCG7109_AG_00060 [Chlamydiales bacterium SCGC AG-110-M15]